MSPVAPQQREAGRFGKYRLVDRIAVGGMAEIFLAQQEEEDGRESPVVIKRIRPHLSKHAAFVKMFLNEARLAAQLNHPNVVQIHDLGKIADSYFIAMEYVAGRDMRRVVPKAEALGIPFPLVYAMKIASCVCAGLHHAHTKVDLYDNPLNIVHRDVSPENIVVAFDGSVKILDFGIAKASNQVSQTRTGEVKGKLSYMSPEQCLGKALDCRSDVFSLGVVLYEWLTGFKLFTGESEVAVMRSITEGKIYAPSYFLPERVEVILMKALERDRERRYQTAAEMQRDLDDFLDAYDFTPTPLHLANFIKQLFEEELQEETRRTRSRAATAPTAEDALELSEVATAMETASPPVVAEPPPAITAPLTIPPGIAALAPGGPDERTEPRMLAVPLTAELLEALESVARRNDVPPGRMVAELLESWLKYR
ncbi:serine/threonine protein kinase [Myxococcus stipitatus DSM 14675]|uniref:Serine/threonine protein kinase n=1 Tax=Myxococcus stipitatus (strain DSM 14675 / JCM 12634 / Mx s8) TaxID=1278073 RepID=L7UH61_MYXSD|nr:serine/threonine-protein kinase [Myxococcus stipitatus]AGC46882.1 serine/threonine protein kinase [Myxococcus stipitatus DSM 14675]